MRRMLNSEARSLYLWQYFSAAADDSPVRSCRQAESEEGAVFIIAPGCHRYSFCHHHHHQFNYNIEFDSHPLH